MNFDDYSEVINGEDTYKEIARELGKENNVIIGWTDQEGTHYDILFTFCALKYGSLQGGVKGGDLFVSIMRVGAFGFDIQNEDTAPGYFSEKLHIGGGSTAVKLAELINGVKKNI